jgi:hypothetical protein
MPCEDGCRFALLQIFLAENVPKRNTKPFIELLSSNPNPSYASLKGGVRRVGQAQACDDHVSKLFYACVKERTCDCKDVLLLSYNVPGGILEVSYDSAAGAASICVGREGAMTSLPAREEVNELLA